MTPEQMAGRIEEEAEKFASTLKSEGIDVMEAICLVMVDTDQGPGLVVLSTEEAPDSLRRKMLTKALERK